MRAMSLTGVVIDPTGPTALELARYFGEAAWTDPAAFMAAVWTASWAPAVLADPPFVRELARADWRRWDAYEPMRGVA